MIVTVACLLGACKADLPGLADDINSTDASCQTAADLLINFIDATGQDLSAQAGVVLDSPDEQTVVIAQDSVLSVGFLGLGGALNVRDRDDVRIHAVGSDDVEVAVYAGLELEQMHYIGALTNDDLDVDFACGSVSAALYVRLVGLAGTLVVDSFEILRQGCETAETGEAPTCP